MSLVWPQFWCTQLNNHLGNCRFLCKKLNQLYNFLIGLAFTCQTKISTIILIFFFLLKLLDYLWEQLVFIPFFDNFIFWKRLFPKIGPYFCRFAIKWTQVQTKEYFAAWFNFLGRNLYLVGCANVCTKSEVILCELYIIKKSDGCFCALKAVNRSKVPKQYTSWVKS